MGDDARGRAHARPAPQLPLQHLDAVPTSCSDVAWVTRARHVQLGDGVPDAQHLERPLEAGPTTTRPARAPTTAGRSATATRRPGPPTSTPTTPSPGRSRTSRCSRATSTRPTRTPIPPTRSIRAPTSTTSAPIRWPSPRTAPPTSPACGRTRKFEERVLGDGGEYPVLRRAMDTLLGQYGIALGMAVKYVGGQYVTRVIAARRARSTRCGRCRRRSSARRSTSSGSARSRPTRSGLAGAAQPAGADRWLHWGMASGFGGPVRLDYDLHDGARHPDRAARRPARAAAAGARARGGVARARAVHARRITSTA